ncbi:MAG: recombinase family protein [Sedimentisphaerales bacterium]|nr:recombinase family protein [Sedimentisphaerales bacterium]
MKDDRMETWWTKKDASAEGQPRLRAVAYYRHSAEIGQENSVEIQQDNVRAFAGKHGIEIIQEFADRGKSGLNAEGRPAFNEMLEWVKTRTDFGFVFVLDVSRWGRFQDTDLSAHYESVCTQHGKQVVYTNIGFTRDEDRLINQLRKNIDRYQSAETSRTLSKKVFEGAAKVAHQGYRPGGPPPYAFHRLMLDENKEPDRILQPGQRKAIQNGRVVLVPGEAGQVDVVQEIFVLFVEKGFDERQIAGHLNAKGTPSPGGVRWSESCVRHILTNQQYAGAVVYNRTTQRLKTKRRVNPPEQWIITPHSYDPIISAELWEGAQAILAGRKRRYTRDHMLQRLTALYEKYNVVTSSLIRFDEDSPSPATVAAKFGGLTGAFQAMFGDVLKRVRNDVFEAISQEARLVDEHDDFIVINQEFTVLIQPSVPMPDGYGAFWSFRPDQRSVVDITLGVPLSNGGEYEILGYLALPRLMVPQRWVRLSASSNARIELQGYNGLDLIRDLLK